jgi:hypothetical protein
MKKLLENEKVVNFSISVVSVAMFYAVYLIGIIVSSTLAVINYKKGLGIDNIVFGLITDAFIVAGVIISNMLYRKAHECC